MQPPFRSDSPPLHVVHILPPIHQYVNYLKQTLAVDRLETATLKPFEAMFRARFVPITPSP